MDLGIEIKDSKIFIKWADLRADYYKLFCKKDDVFYECARVYNETSVRLSLVKYGDNECFVQAYKNDILIDESSVKQFKFDTVDVVSQLENGKTRVFCSEFDDADGYRLYKNEEEIGFNGFKNTDKPNVLLDLSDNTEYKIKPFVKTDSGREFLASSKIFKTNTNRFESISVYKSYNYNLFLSWNFQGDADGFLVYCENSSQPIYETNDGHAHHLSLFDYKSGTKFIVKAFVNTPTGRLILSESEKASLTIRKFDKPDVSIIIPAYNAKDYIARSIDSALASNFANLEIVIVNDGSTDDTQKIIDWYDKNYENVVSIQKENGGVADARNVGIEAAKGEFIAFMDNDDLIRPDMISKLYNAIGQSDCAIAPLFRITDNGYTVHCNLPFLPNVPYKIDKYLEIMYTPGYYNCAIWNKLYRASIVKEHPLGILKYEDVSWTPCIMSYVKEFVFIPTPLYEWDRKTRPETFGDVLAKMPESELFEHRKQAMLFFVQNGNPSKREYMKTIAKRRLARYAKNSSNPDYNKLIEEINDRKY